MAVNTQLFLDAAVTAFNAFGDIIKTVTYRQVAPGTYDPATGTQSAGITDTSTRTVAFQINRRESQREVDLEDQRVERAVCVIIQSELSGITPQIDDEIFTLQGSTWRVERVQNINGVLWDLEIRAVKK